MTDKPGLNEIIQAADGYSPDDNEYRPAGRALMKQPQGSGNPYERRAHGGHNAQNESQQHEQRHARYACNQKTNASEKRLDQCGTENSINNAAHRLARKLEQMLAS